MDPPGHNYCRNPGNLRESPWCYVGPDDEMESCDINKCTAVGRWTIVLLLGLFFLKFEDVRGGLVPLVFG